MGSKRLFIPGNDWAIPTRDISHNTTPNEMHTIFRSVGNRQWGDWFILHKIKVLNSLGIKLQKNWNEYSIWRPSSLCALPARETDSNCWHFASKASHHLKNDEDGICPLHIVLYIFWKTGIDVRELRFWFPNYCSLLKSRPSLLGDQSVHHCCLLLRRQATHLCNLICILMIVQYATHSRTDKCGHFLSWAPFSFVCLPSCGNLLIVITLLS